MQTQQNKMLLFFFPGKGFFYILQIFTFDNYIFHREKQLFFRYKIFTMCWFCKKSGKKIRMVLKPNMVGALELIFSQVYITRPCLQFYRPPKFSRIFCFWEFRSNRATKKWQVFWKIHAHIFHLYQKLPSGLRETGDFKNARNLFQNHSK